MNQKALWGVITVIVALLAIGWILQDRKVEAPITPSQQEANQNNTIENPAPVSDAPKGKLAPGTQAPGTLAQVQANTWVWTKTVNGDGSIVTPNKPGIFTLTFDKAGRVSGKTDCNSFGGDYQIGSDGIISFGPFMSTLMACEGSQESVFNQAVSNSTSYTVNANEELVLHMKDKGTVYFKKQ